MCVLRCSGTLGFIDKVESCTWATVTTMTPVVLTFCGSVFCNMKARSLGALEGTCHLSDRQSRFSAGGAEWRGAASSVSSLCESSPLAAQVLQHANVETFIVLRSTTPLVVAVVDAIFRPYAAIFPSLKTWTSLVRADWIDE